MALRHNESKQGRVCHDEKEIHRFFTLERGEEPPWTAVDGLGLVITPQGVIVNTPARCERLGTYVPV